jgi:hypothetical protein
MAETRETDESVFYEDKRASWRVSWIFAYAFLLVVGLMQHNAAGLWQLPFLGIAALTFWIGITAITGRTSPLLAVSPDGLRVFAGDVGLGGTGDAAEYLLPWSAVNRVAFEERRIRNRYDSDHMQLTVLCFEINDAISRPDGHRGFLAKLADRTEQWALGEHLTWNPESRKIDLMVTPRGGYAKLTAAISDFASKLADPSLARRNGLGGPLAYAIFDVGLAVAVLGTVVLLSTGQMGIYSRLAARIFEWGGSVQLPLP